MDGYERIFCEDLDSACEALDNAMVDYDIDSADRIIAIDFCEIIEILDNEGIDYDIV